MGKGLNPADAFRKEEKKKAIKKSKKQQEEIKNIQSLLNNPTKINDEIEKLQKESQENRLDKSIKDKIKELESMRIVALKKEKIKNDALRTRESFLNPNLSVDTKSSTSTELISTDKSGLRNDSIVLDSSTSAESLLPSSSSSAVASTGLTETKQITQSVYYHPVYNPAGVPPPGQQQIYKATTTNKTPPLVVQHSMSHLMSQPQPTNMHPSSMMNNGINNVVIGGGLSGIPLPPPRPPLFQGIMPASLPPPPPQYVPPQMFHQPQIFMHQQQQPFINQQQQQQQQQSNRRQSMQIAPVDPLDPTNSHYTERFQHAFSRPQPPNQQSQMSSSTLQTLSEEEMEEDRLIEMRLAKLKGDILSTSSSNSIEDSNTASSEMNQMSKPPTLSIPPPPQPPSFAKLRATSQNPLVIETKGVEESIHTASTNISLSSSSSSSPSSPIVSQTQIQVPSLSNSILPLSKSALEAIMNRRRQVVTAPTSDIAPVLPDTDIGDQVSTTTTTVIETITHTSKKRPLEVSVLSGLLDYPDDDDDSDGDEEDITNKTDDKTVDISENQSSSSSSSYPCRVTTTAASTMPIGPLPGPLSAAALSDMDNINTYNESSNIHYSHLMSGYEAGGGRGEVMAIGSKKSKLLPVIKADAGLRSFVPSSLRTKRLGDGISNNTNPIKLKPKSTESVVASSQATNLPSTSGPAPINLSAGVDDAYNDFLNEINQLT